MGPSLGEVLTFSDEDRKRWSDMWAHIDAQRTEILFLRSEIERLQDELDQVNAAYRAVMAEMCGDSGMMKHCTCVPFLRMAVQRRNDMLRRLEWRCIPESSRWYRCPMCGRRKTSGHTAACELAALLKECER